MTSHDQQSESEALRAKLNRETSRMPWQELLRYFAGGSVIAVSDDLDLVDVAMRFTQDDKPAVAQWLTEKRLGQVTDDEAKQWLEADVALWTVVVRPWVLVQLNKTV